MTTPNDIALLREALKPFAELADAFDEASRRYVGVPIEGQLGATVLPVGGETARRTCGVTIEALIAARAALAPGQHDGAAGPSEEWLNDPASLEGGLPTIPTGMKPWPGGDSAPADWDADNGSTLWRNGEIISAEWCDHASDWQWSGHSSPDDIIAYTPKPSTEQARAEGYVLVPRVPTEAIIASAFGEMADVARATIPAVLLQERIARAYAAMLAAAGEDVVGSPPTRERKA